MTTAPRPRWPWRRLAWLTATALPVLLLAAAASHVLIRYLHARDALGPWHLTITDDHGSELGHAKVVLVATKWSTSWSWTHPFVTFDPDVEVKPFSGNLTWTDDGAHRLRALDLTPDGWTLERARHTPGGDYLVLDLYTLSDYPRHVSGGRIVLTMATVTGTCALAASDQFDADVIATFHATLSR
jgi:hypothetical protein